MNESPGDRFRRIIAAWRKEEQQKQSSAVTPASDTPSRAAQPAETDHSSALPSVGPAQPQPPKAPPSSPKPVRAVDISVPASPETPDAKLLKAAQPAEPSLPPVDVPPDESELILDKFMTPADARDFLERLRDKIKQVVQDFSTGAINQRQFQAVYSHYQRQRIEVEKALIEMPGSGAWRAAAVEGHTSFLRQQHAAQVLSYAIYDTATGASLSQVGDVSADAALLESVLGNFRAGADKVFGAGMQYTQIEGGRWLYFVPGKYTTLAIVFSAEPATIQLKAVEDAHRDFEMVNAASLTKGDISQLTFTFTHLWAFEPGFFDS